MRKYGCRNALEKFRKPTKKSEIIDYLKKIKNRNLQNFAYIQYMTGLRISELCNLMWTNVKLDKNYINTVNRKGGKDRIVYLTKDATEYLKKLKGEQKTESEYIFPGKSKGGLSINTVHKWIERERKDGNLDYEFTPHKLRHTYASELYNTTKNIAIVRDQLGHDNIYTTSIYIHTNDKERKNIILNINEPLGDNGNNEY